MTKLPDEIERIAQIVDNYIASKDYYSANEMRELLTKNLTHPTDEAIEKPTDRIDEAFKYYYEWENVYAFEECKVSDERIFREAIQRFMPKEVDGIEKEEPIPQCICPDSRCYHWWWPKEVEPPTKDTIEKIDWVYREVEWKTPPPEWANYITKYDKEIDKDATIQLLLDTVNHQQEQIQQLLSEK